MMRQVAGWVMRMLGRGMLGKMMEEARSMKIRMKSVCREWRDLLENLVARNESITRSATCHLVIGAPTVAEEEE